MARMMAKSRWQQKPSWYCCPGHDPDWYFKGQQRARERRKWMDEYYDDQPDDCEWCQRHEADGLYDLDGVETGMCSECAEDNDAKRIL